MFSLSRVFLVPLVFGVASTALAEHQPQHQPSVGSGEFAFDDSQNGRLRRVVASTISEIPVAIAPGEVLEIITSNPEANGDPALHLLRQDTKEEVAFDDSTDGGHGARLTYNASSGAFIVVVRARIPGEGGTTRLFRGSQVWKEDVPFGGAQLRYGDLLAGEALQTVALPGGPVSNHVIYMLDTNAQHITHRRTWGGVGGAARLELDEDLGARTGLFGTQGAVAPGVMRVVRNDAGVPGSDPDGDGLGTALERDIGTCDATAQTVPGAEDETFDCSRVADLRDTDGDGLRDDWETLGLLRTYERSPNVRVHESLRLPAWGASPRHKDVFVEVDFMKRSANEMVQRMTEANARTFAKYYGDQVGTPTAEEIARRAGVLGNPDGLNGIRVHLDIGRAPTVPSDRVIFGDWGGFTAVEPVQNGSGTLVGADYATVWLDTLSPARRGIFRYILGYAGGGGQTGINSFAATGPINGVDTLAHEFGHAMGMGHSGPPNATGVVDPNCKPNYPSLMNYAYLPARVGFSDGRGRPPLNNVALQEFQAVDPANTVYFDQLETVFRYWVDRGAGHVDWNRDGEIAPAGTTVRGYVNYRPGGGGCEFTRYNKSPIPQAASFQSPGLTRLQGKLVMVNATLGLPFVTRETARSACGVPSLASCIDWTVPNRIPLIDATGGLDIARIGRDREERGLLVAIGADGSVVETRLRIDDSGNERWSTPQTVAEPGSAIGEPSLAKLGACALFLAYRDADGFVTTRRLTCADDFTRWQAPLLAVDQTGTAIRLPDEVSPGIGRAYLNEPGRAELYGAFANGQNEHLALYRFSSGNQNWTRMNIVEANSGPIRGRPSMAWVSEESVIDFPGRLYLLYVQRDNTGSFRDKRRTIRMMWSYTRVAEAADGTLTRSIRVGLPGPFDNVWNYAFGIDAFFEAGVDRTLQTMQSVAINKPAVWGRLEYRPKADGGNDFSMTNFDDWDTMAKVLCRNLVDAGGTVAAPAVVCP